MSKAQKTVTKKEIVATIAGKVGMPINSIHEVVQHWMDQLTSELSAGNRVELREFGVFEVRQRKARIARNPKTGDAVQVPARAAVTFKPGKVMKEQVSRSATVVAS